MMKLAISWMLFLSFAVTLVGCGSSAAPPANLPKGGTGFATENAGSGAIAAAGTEERAKDDPDAVASLEELGAELETDDTGLVTAVTLPKGTVVAGLKLLSHLPGLKQLSLAGSEVSDDDLAVVALLEPLERLDLSWTQVSDAGIARLKQLRRLESLDLSWTGISGANLADLSGLVGLKRLSAEGTELADDGGMRLHEVLPDAEIVTRTEPEAWVPEESKKRQTTSRRRNRPRANDGNAGVDEPEPLAIGREAPEIEGNDVDGIPFKLSDYRGKIVVLDFWATWCGPCVQEMPILAKVADEYREKGVALFCVNQLEPADEIRMFLDQKKLAVTVCLDSDGTVGKAYGAKAIPMLVLIDKAGIVQRVHVGFSPKIEATLKTELDALLDGKDLASEAKQGAEE